LRSRRRATLVTGCRDFLRHRSGRKFHGYLRSRTLLFFDDGLFDI
jgi:hypothetical protein